MSFIYKQVENITYKGYPVYYRELANVTIHPAHKFNSQYVYYYINPDDQNMKKLGSFQRIERRNSGLPYHDYDYDVYIFDNETIYTDKIKNLYCELIIEDIENENMQVVENMGYKDQSLFYKLK